MNVAEKSLGRFHQVNTALFQYKNIYLPSYDSFVSIVMFVWISMFVFFAA